MVIIYTKQLHETGLMPEGNNVVVMDPKDVDACIPALQEMRKFVDKISIYDLCPSTKNTEEIIPVNDHVNRTGENPLIGRQGKLNVEFPDITSLYVKKENGVTTFCCGNHEPLEKIEYPSMYLSNISILARVLDFKEIHGYIVK
jgi:hypothetical protein